MAGLTPQGKGLLRSLSGDYLMEDKCVREASEGRGSNDKSMISPPEFYEDQKSIFK